MRKSILTSAVFLLLLAGCTGDSKNVGTSSAQPLAFPEDKPYAVSGVPAEDCLLCSGLRGSQYSCTWGQDNLALISFNTAEVMPIEINRYNRGELIEEYAGYVCVSAHDSGQGGFDAVMYAHTDRGFASGCVTLHEDTALDPDRAAKYFCEDCVRSALDNCLGTPCGVGMLHLQTGEVLLFGERTLGFQLEDFYVDNHAEEDALDLFVVYCPERYKK